MLLAQQTNKQKMQRYKHTANSLWKQTLHVANLIKALILTIPHCYHSVVISPWCSSVLGLSLWSGEHGYMLSCFLNPHQYEKFSYKWKLVALHYCTATFVVSWKHFLYSTITKCWAHTYKHTDTCTNTGTYDACFNGDSYSQWQKLKTKNLNGLNMFQ